MWKGIAYENTKHLGERLVKKAASFLAPRFLKKKGQSRGGKNPLVDWGKFRCDRTFHERTNKVYRSKK